jgi:hypothetical protein
VQGRHHVLASSLVWNKQRDDRHDEHEANLPIDPHGFDEFLSRFPVPNWISIINLYKKYSIRKSNPDSNLFYRLANKQFSEPNRTRLNEHSHIPV